MVLENGMRIQIFFMKVNSKGTINMVKGLNTTRTVLFCRENLLKVNY